jgi:hypothetical protein
MRTSSLPRRASLLAGAMSVIMFTAACSPSTGGEPESSTGEPPPPPPGLTIRVAASGSDSPRSSDGALLDERMMRVPPEYILSPDFQSDLSGPADGWSLAVMSQLDEDVVNRVLAALGFDETADDLVEDVSGGWRIGPTDGTAPAVWFAKNAAQSWWYQSAWGGEERPVDCWVVGNESEKFSSTELNERRTATTETDGDEPVEAPDEIACEEPAPVEGVPTEDVAIVLANDLLKSVSDDAFAFDIEAHADDWAAWATAWGNLDGKRTDMMWSFNFGENAEVTFGSGNLGQPVPAGDIERISVDEGFRRLQEGPQMWWWGGSGGVIAFAAEGNLDGDELTVTPAEEIAPYEPGEEPITPIGDPEQTEPEAIELVEVRESLWTIFDLDGTMWLLPAYTFIDSAGGEHAVPAFSEDLIEVVESDQTFDTQIEDPGLDTLIGMTEDEATAQIADWGWSSRVIQVDGEGLAVTMDFDPTRVNLTIEDGVVTAISTG